MKLKYQLSVTKIDGEYMAVPTEGEFHGIIRMNETTADILKCLETDLSEDVIVAKLATVYDASTDDLRKSVAEVIKSLRNNGLIME